MAYTPTNWKTGDTVTSTKLNKLEQGVADAITAPSSPATGAFLVFNGSAWVGQTLSTWSGGSY